MGPSTTLDDVQPRPEAQPLAWDEDDTSKPYYLTEDQRKAAEQTCKLLRVIAERKAAVTSGEASGVNLFLPPIDRDRLNHVVLLDGGRGSGKTAILVTLLDAMSWIVRNENALAQEEHRPHPRLLELLATPGLIVPVGLVDLQPLPASTNLLLYIVGRFQRVVEAIEQSTGHEGARAPWHATGEDEPKCKTRWNAFLRAAAMGWDEGLAGRRANLDPEAFALEVEQAERQRLDVVTSFRRFVDALVEDWGKFRRKPKGPAPLFVLSIDDADMNPARSVELLELVRTLWHPQVAFLLTGHSELFREALRVHVLGTLRKPLKGLPGLEEEAQRTLNPRLHDRLATEMYDKVIPSAHRCELLPLDADERYARIVDVLAQNGESAAAIRALFENYEGLKAALPTRLRPLLDSKQLLRSLLQAGPRGGVLEARVLEHLWTSSLADPQLPEDLRRRLAAWMIWNGTGVALQIETGLEFHVNPAQWTTHKIPSVGRATVGQGIQITGILSGTSAGANNHVLPDGIMACIIAVLDLGNARRLRVVNTPYPFIRNRHAYCSLEVEAAELVSYIPWAVPRWGEFSRWIQFAKRWSQKLPTLVEQPELDLAELATHFVAAILGDASIRPAEGVSHWEHMARRAATWAVTPLADVDDVEPVLIAWAQGTAPLLAAPESGLPEQAANTWLDVFRDVLDKAERWGDIMLVHEHLTDTGLFLRGQRPEQIRVSESEVRMLQTAASWLRREIAAREITIEANPSSNLLIGDMQSVEEHPAFRFQPLPGRPEDGEDPVHLSINTDDPITFATSIAHEFAYLYGALLREGVSSHVALAWLERRREDGWRSRFTLAASADATAVRELIPREERARRGLGHD